MGRVGWVGWVGQFAKWHSKTRLTGAQALDKVWSHLKKHVPKSLCSRSKSDRRFNPPRMEKYVYSYMWRFNNRNWLKQLGQLCQQHWQKENASANDVFFFFRCFLLPNLKSQKLSSAPSFGGFFYTSVKIQNRKKRGNYQWFWYGPCCPKCKLPGVTNNAGTMFFLRSICENHMLDHIHERFFWDPFFFSSSGQSMIFFNERINKEPIFPFLKGLVGGSFHLNHDIHEHLHNFFPPTSHLLFNNHDWSA